VSHCLLKMLRLKRFTLHCLWVQGLLSSVQADTIKRDVAAISQSDPQRVSSVEEPALDIL